jgi:hypothetical protein
MRDGRLTQERIDEFHALAPDTIAAEVAALRTLADELATGDAAARRRAGALRARATVLSSRGDLAQPIEYRVKKPTRTAHRHRSRAEYEKIVAAHGAILGVMGYIERVSGLTARWTGWLGFTHPADAGAMGFDGSLRISRNYLAPLAALGEAAITTRAAAAKRSRRAQLQGREAGMVLVHEGFHAISPFSQRAFEQAPGAEESLAEICMALFYAEAMREVFGKEVAEAEPLDYPRYREPLERIAHVLGVQRTDFAERAFYLGLLRRRTLKGRLGYLERALLTAGFGPAYTGKLVENCAKAWTSNDGGESGRTSYQRPPRRATKSKAVTS